MIRRQFLQAGAGALFGRALSGQDTSSGQLPNIVIIYADDLGYGDVGCYGATAVRTPNIDRVAARGVRFTDAHSSAATCTPSRYSLLTGEYSFRRAGARVLPGDAPLLIEPGRPTMASILRERGYRTGVVGKWHLGLGTGNVDWNREIKPGPSEIGFDYSFLIPATGDRVPCVYVENGRVVGLDPKDPIQVSFAEPVGEEPTGKAHPEMLRMHPSHGHDMTIVNGISRIGYMKGGKSARWIDAEMARVISRKAVDFINRNRAQRFLLYFSTHDIHVPRVPHARFAKATTMGPRGNAIAQLDWSVGQILDSLDRNRLAEKTLVVLTSDNGPVVDDGYRDQAVEKLGSHKPSGGWRGGKYSAFEAGTRVPFLVRWPRRVKPGVSDALIGQLDLVASLATLTGHKLTPEAAPDSFDMLPALLGDSKVGRDHLIEQAGTLAIRSGTWKLILAGKGARLNPNVNIELGNDREPQLYDLSRDPGEMVNVAGQHPERVRALTQQLEKIRSAGRSRP